MHYFSPTKSVLIKRIDVTSTHMIPHMLLVAVLNASLVIPQRAARAVVAVPLAKKRCPVRGGTARAAGGTAQAKNAVRAKEATSVTAVQRQRRSAQGSAPAPAAQRSAAGRRRRRRAPQQFTE